MSRTFSTSGFDFLAGSTAASTAQSFQVARRWANARRMFFISTTTAWVVLVLSPDASMSSIARSSASFNAESRSRSVGGGRSSASHAAERSAIAGSAPGTMRFARASSIISNTCQSQSLRCRPPSHLTSRLLPSFDRRDCRLCGIDSSSKRRNWRPPSSGSTRTPGGSPASTAKSSIQPRQTEWTVPRRASGKRKALSLALCRTSSWRMRERSSVAARVV